MTNFINALQFLTILRFCKKNNINAGSTAYFPLIGALLGLILILLNHLFSSLLPEPVVNPLLVISLMILTGGLHLDGLADTADAIFSGKPKEEKLIIMRDPRKGSFAILALISIILLKINLLSTLPALDKNLGLFLMPCLSRYSMDIGIAFFPYARETGKAKIFFENKRPKVFITATALSVILMALTFNLISYLVLPAIIIFSVLLNAFIKKTIGGLTGDTLGALCELTELAVLFLILILT